jgi:ribosomal protein L17
MSVRIQYAYLKQQTWLYRRNYPKELQPLLGQAYKQSLKTGDARIAKARAAEVNAKYEEIITKAKSGQVVEKPQPVKIVAPAFTQVTIVGRVSVAELGKQYLNRRSNELQHGGFKSVRFSVGLFVSAFGKRPIGTVHERTRWRSPARWLSSASTWGSPTGPRATPGAASGPERGGEDQSADAAEDRQSGGSLPRLDRLRGSACQQPLQDGAGGGEGKATALRGAHRRRGIYGCLAWTIHG